MARFSEFAVGAGDSLLTPAPIGAGDSFPDPIVPDDLLIEAGFNPGQPPVSAGSGNTLPAEARIEVQTNSLLVEVSCTIESLEPALPCADRAFVVGRSGDQVRVTPLSPGMSYIAHVVSVDALGIEIRGGIPFQVIASVKNSEGYVVASRAPREFWLLEALTFAIGKVVQAVGGSPACRAVEDVQVGSSLLLVNSTLGFPRSGELIVGATRIKYKDTCDTAFLLEEPVLLPVRTNTVVLSAAKATLRRPQ
jgi:hypothetical protein